MTRRLQDYALPSQGDGTAPRSGIPGIARMGLILGLITASAMAADWPHFLGPRRDNTAADTGLARSWPEGGPRQLWRVSLGQGFAGPAVFDGRVYILDRQENQQDVLRCLSMDDGSEMWQYAYDAPGKFSYGGSRSTPTVTEDSVYTIGPMGHLLCLDRETHTPRWRKHLLDDFGGKRPNWAVAQSPLVLRDMVIVAPLSDRVGVVALDRRTGEPIWQSKPLGSMNYSSPRVTTLGEVEQILMLSGQGTVSGMRASDGEVLWSYTGWTCRIPIVTPMPLGDGRIFITGEYGAGSAMIRVSAEAGIFTVAELYKTGNCESQIHQPLLHGGHLYMNGNGNQRRDGFVCVDLDGNVKWRTGNAPNFERGAVLLADGMIYAVDGNTGALALFEARPDRFEKLAEARVLEGKQSWGPLVLVDGKLLLRDQRQLKCVDVKTAP